jgi:hypothetical protein
MAIITTSPIVSEIRGSVGTQTFSKNHHRPYVKVRKAPARPASSYRSFATSNLSDVVTQWLGETDATRAAWGDVSDQYFAHSRLGKKSKLSGYNAYVRANMNAIYCSGSFNPIPVVSGNCPRIISFTSTFLVSGLAVTFVIDRLDTRFNYILKVSNFSSAGKMSNNSVAYYGLRGGACTGTTNSPTVSTFFNSRFPGIAGKAGFKLFIQLYLVDTLNGVAFPPVFVSGILH